MQYVWQSAAYHHPQNSKIDLMAATADLSAFRQLSPVPTSVLAANGSTIIPSSSLFVPIKDLVAIVYGSTIILPLTDPFRHW
jgi:hypothetical protein